MQLIGSMRSILISALVPTVACSSALAQTNATSDNSKPQNRPVRSSTAATLQAETPLRIQRAQTASTSSVSPGAAVKTSTGAATSSASSSATSKPVVAAGAKPAVAASAKPGANASPLERGKYFSRHGAYSDAYNFFTKAADADPKNPETYNRRARVEWQLEKNEEALEDVRYAIKLNPDYAEAFCTRAAILNSTEHYHDAIVDTSLAVELKPKLKEAYTIQASAYRNLKQYREADELMAKLAAIKDPVFCIR